MKFETPVLRLDSSGDPLWLYKVCVSLVHEAALTWGHGTGREGEAAAGFIAGQVHRSDPAVAHVLAPVVDVLAQEAASLNRVFHLFPGQQAELLHEHVRRDVLDHFKKAAALRALHDAGEITAEEFNKGAFSLIQTLDKYGSNGQEAMLRTWDATGRNLIGELRASETAFVPAKIEGQPNITNKTFSRAAYYEQEHAYLSRLAEVKPMPVMHNACLAAIGPEYQAAIEAKEALLCTHLKKKVILGSEGAVRMAALHPRYERAQKAAIRGVDPVYSFRSPTLAGEIGGQEGARVMQAIDAEAAKAFDRSAIVRELRGTAAGAEKVQHAIAGPAKPEGPALKGTNTTTAKSPSVEHSSPSKAGLSGQAAEATHGHHTGTRLALGGAAGLALYDGLKHLREEPKPGDDPKGGTFRFARVLEVGIGAAGLAATMLCKGATFEKLFGGRGK